TVAKTLRGFSRAKESTDVAQNYAAILESRTCVPVAGEPLEILWRIHLLGGLSAVGRGREITRFRSHKAACLLAYLAYHPGRLHPREALADMLWPESEAQASRLNLRRELSELRGLLEAEPVPKG